MLLIANYSQFVGKKQVSGRFLDYFANLHNVGLPYILDKE